ncbi:MAG: glycosyltransferase family A protein [Pseudomonadota bacterium]
MNVPLVTFVIPHKGRENMLRETLSSIGAQIAAPVFEIVLVSQNASLEAPTETLLSTLPVRVLKHPESSTIAALRNAGVIESRGEFLAFLDADVALAEDWLATLVPLLTKDDSVILASARQEDSAGAPPLERIRTTLANAGVDRSVTFLPGRNLLVARTDFDRVGGFPSELVTCEDYVFTERLASLGALAYTSKTHYVHLGEDKAYGAMFRKEIWRGQSNLASLGGRRLGPAELPSFLVPPWVTGLAIASAAVALLGYTAWAASLLFAAALPVAAYVTRLYLLAGKSIALPYIISFYALYFPARTLGTLLGLVHTVKTDSH